jgi:uncharacterized protein YoaH (UPF0181 family)
MFKHIKECMADGFETGGTIPVAFLIIILGLLIFVICQLGPNAVELLKVLMTVGIMVGEGVVLVMVSSYIAGLINRFL